jgi:hypothetical protein
VNDTEPPTVNCPSNIIVNLNPGLCSAFVNYNVTASDNCPFIAQGPSLQFPVIFAAHGGGTVFSLSGNTAPGGVFFNLTNTSPDPVIVTGFGVRFGNPAFGVVNAPQTLQLFTAPTYVGNETNAGAWTNVGPAVVNPIPPYFPTGTGPLGQANLTSNVSIPPGQTRGFFIFGQTACPIFNWNFGGAVPPITNGPLTITAGSISFGQFGPMFQTGPIGMPNIQVNTQDRRRRGNHPDCRSGIGQRIRSGYDGELLCSDRRTGPDGHLLLHGDGTRVPEPDADIGLQRQRTNFAG